MASITIISVEIFVGLLLYLLFVVRPIRMLIADKIYCKLASLRSDFYNYDKTNKGQLPESIYHTIRKWISNMMEFNHEITFSNIYFSKNNNKKAESTDKIFAEIKKINNEFVNISLNKLYFYSILTMINNSLGVFTLLTIILLPLIILFLIVDFISKLNIKIIKEHCNYLVKKFGEPILSSFAKSHNNNNHLIPIH